MSDPPQGAERTAHPDAPRGAERTADRERLRARARARARAIVAHAGLREPVVVVLLLIAFFSAISGKPLDGLFMLAVATGLAWDAGARLRADARHPAGAVDPGLVVTVPDGGPGSGPDSGPASGLAAPDSRRPPAALWRPRLLGLAVLAGGALYAAVVGSFSRYSWPATIGVVGLGAVVLVIGWRGPLRARRIPPRPRRLGVALWGGLLVAGGVWELAALLEQPSLTASSAAHPTISTLTDPLLGSPAGRAVALAVWLVLGCFLVLR